ncbi:hypothetical protein EV421DRAFT_1729521 [Armillaria borealis]|uniref:Uncharacterized protein n=1 Tax=Armillaria borealis TaxID=47425 RepID=A0AA39K4N8_9AGAR|nr:hypothetical protein EV421DRAFT_1729521 [Armillaria borealis]
MASVGLPLKRLERETTLGCSMNVRTPSPICAFDEYLRDGETTIVRALSSAHLGVFPIETVTSVILAKCFAASNPSPALVPMRTSVFPLSGTVLEILIMDARGAIEIVVLPNISLVQLTPVDLSPRTFLHIHTTVSTHPPSAHNPPIYVHSCPPLSSLLCISQLWLVRLAVQVWISFQLRAFVAFIVQGIPIRKSHIFLRVTSLGSKDSMEDKGLSQVGRGRAREMIDMMVGTGEGEPGFASRLTNDHERRGLF